MSVRCLDDAVVDDAVVDDAVVDDAVVDDAVVGQVALVELVAVALGDDACSAVHALDRLTAWCEAERLRRVGELEAAGRLGAISDTTLRTSHEVEALLRRASVAAASPDFAQALHAGRLSPGHLDQLGHTLRRLDPAQRSSLLAETERLLLAAVSSSASEFGRLLRREERRLGRVAGMSTLEQQRRAVRLRGRTDRDTGMRVYTWWLDPVSSLSFERRLDAATEALFHDRTPPLCPADPLERQAFLRAHALLGLLDGNGSRMGRPEVIVVVDTTVAGQPPEVDWGLPVEIPHRVLHDLWGRGDVHAVVVRNGVVLHAPGELDLGRTTRLANRAQRRALRALYRGCALPGCETSFDHCTIHHVQWWRHGGATDLCNLLPVCSRHHRLIHDGGWTLALGPDRSLTVRRPDGTVRTTGPPSRAAA